MFKFINEAEAITDAIKATPPITVSGVAMSGVDLNLYIQVGTIIYIALLIIDKLWTLYKRKKEKDEPSQ